MSRKTVILGMYICPNCKKHIPVIWDGNLWIRCPICGARIKVRRQRILAARHIMAPREDHDDH